MLSQAAQSVGSEPHPVATHRSPIRPDRGVEQRFHAGPDSSSHLEYPVVDRQVQSGISGSSASSSARNSLHLGFLAYGMSCRDHSIATFPQAE